MEKLKIEEKSLLSKDFSSAFASFEDILGVEIINEFNNKLANVLAETCHNRKNIVVDVEKIIEEDRCVGDRVGIVVLDRSIKGNKNGDYFKLDVVITSNGKLNSISDDGETIETQLGALTDWILEGKYEKLILVSKSVDSEDDLLLMINHLKSLIPYVEFSVFWKLSKFETDNISIKDFTFIGGKLELEERSNRKLNFPCFLPFSLPSDSIISEVIQYKTSLKLMDISIDIVEELNKKIGKALEIEDILDAGFGIPSSNLEELQDDMWVPNNEDDLWEYLQYCKHVLINKEEKIKRLISKGN